jgi:hypothetical protein
MGLRISFAACLRSVANYSCLMKKLFLFLALLSAPFSHLLAQVKAEVVLDQEYFLDGEALPAAVRITNRSGQTLQFGETPDWLTFSIESREGFIVAKTSEVPVEGEFKLESGKVATRRVELAPHFTLSRVGRYQIVATVRLKDWNRQITTPPQNFSIVHGAKIWSQEFGVPPPAGTTAHSPEVRRYTLEQVNYHRSQLRMYLRLTGADESQVIKVFPLGPLVSFSNPEHQIDKESRLHVFYQYGARSFCYQVISPAGELLTRQTYDYAETRPRLELSEEGNVVVVGGVRRASPTDLPTPAKTETEVTPENL